jgi:hypothetical protein
MIKKCKWCGKEQEMRGKREFCQGEKCKNAWKYANRTKKLDKKESVNKNQDKTETNNGQFPTIVGQLTKVTTTQDQCVRITVDIPVESVNVDTIQYLNKNVVIAFIEENGKEEKTNKEENGKDKFFND